MDDDLFTLLKRWLIAGAVLALLIGIGIVWLAF